MEITLDRTLKKSTKRIHLPLANLASVIERKLDGSKSYDLVASTISRRVETLQEGFLSCVSRAYSDHEKLEIAPHDIWFLILSEIAIVIRDNTEACQSFLTRSRDMIAKGLSFDDLAEVDLDTLLLALEQVLPVDKSIFLPELSSHTEQSRVAMYAALSGGVKTHYTYTAYTCGIPEIRVMGDVEDWSRLSASATAIMGLFSKTSLDQAKAYLLRVHETLRKIEASFTVSDPDFWRGIFTSRNEGSGGELIIDGWIAGLFYTIPVRPSLQNFMATATVIPFFNRKDGQHFRAVFGAFERHRTADDFIYSEYASLTFEVAAAEEHVVSASPVAKMVDNLMANPIKVD